MKRRRHLSLEQSLEAQVVINKAVRLEERGKELLIVIPRQKSLFTNLFSFFLSVPREKKVVLDEIGAEIYRDCQKGISVSEIVANFENRHHLSSQYSTPQVLLYLRNLAQRGLIGFLIKERS